MRRSKKRYGAGVSDGPQSEVWRRSQWWAAVRSMPQESVVGRSQKYGAGVSGRPQNERCLARVRVVLQSRK